MKFLFLMTLPLFSSLSFATSPPLPPPQAPVEVSGAWIRMPLKGAKNTAGYFLLKNTSKTPIFLIGALSPLSPTVELHEHVHVHGPNGMLMKMQRVEKIEIPAKGEVKFEPMGYHVMFFNLEPISPETKQESIRLQFADGKEFLFWAKLKKDSKAP